MLSGLSTPGAKSSEFLVACLNVVAQVALAWSDEITAGTATKYSFAGAARASSSRTW